MGYKHIPGMLAWRVVVAVPRARCGRRPCARRSDPTEDRKAAAIACYPSQLLALEEDWQIGAKLDAPAPEQFWRIEPPPPGWERLSES